MDCSVAVADITACTHLLKESGCAGESVPLRGKQQSWTGRHVKFSHHGITYGATWALCNMKTSLRAGVLVSTQTLTLQLHNNLRLACMLQALGSCEVVALMFA